MSIPRNLPATAPATASAFVTQASEQAVDSARPAAPARTQIVRKASPTNTRPGAKEQDKRDAARFGSESCVVGVGQIMLGVVMMTLFPVGSLLKGLFGVKIVDQAGGVTPGWWGNMKTAGSTAISHVALGAFFVKKGATQLVPGHR